MIKHDYIKIALGAAILLFLDGCSLRQKATPQNWTHSDVVYEFQLQQYGIFEKIEKTTLQKDSVTVHILVAEFNGMVNTVQYAKIVSTDGLKQKRIFLYNQTNGFTNSEDSLRIIGSLDSAIKTHFKRTTGFPAASNHGFFKNIIFTNYESGFTVRLDYGDNLNLFSKIDSIMQEVNSKKQN